MGYWNTPCFVHSSLSPGFHTAQSLSDGDSPTTSRQEYVDRNFTANAVKTHSRTNVAIIFEQLPYQIISVCYCKSELFATIRDQVFDCDILITSITCIYTVY